MTGVSGNRVSDDKLVAATGRARAEWHGLLDAQDASAWTHPQIARWLEAHGVDGWWAQGITVAYEQARGRAPGQQADGTFSTSSSKSLPGTQQQVLQLIIDAYTAHCGSEPASVSREAKHPTARWKLADGTNVLATVSPGGSETSRAVLTRSKLDNEDSLAQAKAELAKLLVEVASGVDRSVD
jgi:hypothetical protein